MEKCCHLLVRMTSALQAFKLERYEGKHSAHNREKKNLFNNLVIELYYSLVT